MHALPIIRGWCTLYINILDSLMADRDDPCNPAQKKKNGTAAAAAFTASRRSRCRHLGNLIDQSSSAAAPTPARHPATPASRVTRVITYSRRENEFLDKNIRIPVLLDNRQGRWSIFCKNDLKMPDGRNSVVVDCCPPHDEHASTYALRSTLWVSSNYSVVRCGQVEVRLV